MAATPSTMLPLGTKLPEFSLPNVVDGGAVTSRDLGGSIATTIMFICNHCPFVKHVLPELSRLDGDYTPAGVALIAISSNDVAAYPDDAPAKMRALAEREGWTFPYVFDDSQEVAKAFWAACTPDFYVFDGNRTLVYRGQLDGSRPGNDVPLSGADLRRALDAVVAGERVPHEQLPSMGCNIKWKPGNAPEYFGG